MISFSLRAGTLAAAAVLGAGIAFPGFAQAPAGVPVDRVVPAIGPPRDVVWNQGPQTPPKGRRKPNIVLIVADDLGYNDITFTGGVAGGTVPTPNIDSIAREGVCFAQGYAGHGTCAPSRAALLTGRYPTRYGFEFTPVPLGFARQVRQWQYGIHNPVYFADRERDIIPMSEMGIPTGEVTVGQLLQKAGYHTLQLGKWHLGTAEKFLPERRGFSESLGFSSGGSLYLPKGDPRGVESQQDFDPIDKYLWASLPFYVRKDGGEAFTPRRHMTDYLTDEAVAAIDANRNRPFFLYLSYNAPHTPLQPSREDYDALAHIQDHRLRTYGALVRGLDRGVGRVLQVLQERGLEEDTIVIFTSDNGGAGYVGLPDLNKPWRGWKMTFFEGGIHVPFFIRWPGKIRAGTTYHAPVSHFDIFSTVAGVAGAQVPKDRKIDGVDLLPYVQGKKAGRPHEKLFWRTGPYQVVRSGDWKLQVTDLPKKEWLFDLSSDPTERNNLAAARPELVAALKADLASFNAEQSKPLWPELGQGPVMIDHALHLPQHPNDEYVYWGN